MGLTKIRICQLGDVHYPDHSGDLGADNDGFSDDQVRAVTSSRLKQVVVKMPVKVKDRTALP